MSNNLDKSLTYLEAVALIKNMLEPIAKQQVLNEAALQMQASILNVLREKSGLTTEEVKLEMARAKKEQQAQAEFDAKKIVGGTLH